MRRNFELLYGYPVLACFEGDDGDDGDGGDGDGDGGDGDGNLNPDFEARIKQATANAEAAQIEASRKAAEARQVTADAAAAATAAQKSSFSQEDVNTFLADDRRRHQDKYKKLEGSYQDMLADKTLAQEKREKMEADLLDLQKSFRTKEQQAAFDRKKEKERFTSEVSTYKEAAEKWESMYKNSVIMRSLQDAAVEADAFNPTQIVGLLSPVTAMRLATDDDGKELEDKMIPMIDFPDIDEETGAKVVTLRTPQEAVQRMKELPELFGNLFRANVVSGIGAGSATGGAASGKGGRIDPTKLTAAQFIKLRKENPEALGLKRRPS